MSVTLSVNVVVVDLVICKLLTKENVHAYFAVKGTIAIGSLSTFPVMIEQPELEAMPMII